MKVVVISDTHNRHFQLKLPPGDMLIHCGDFTMSGKKIDCDFFANWFSRQNFRLKIFIAGNHDFALQEDPDYFQRNFSDLFRETNTHYLHNSGITLGTSTFGIGKNTPMPEEHFHIWGSPVTPEFHNWAFNKQRGPELEKHWKQIPWDTHLLITHGPPANIRDLTEKGLHVGDADLSNRIRDLPNLKWNCFGHIHEGYGREQAGQVAYINASVLSKRYEMVNKPIVFEI